jgi:hypothetical protein
MATSDGRGVGKAHKNRRLRNGPRCSWLTRVPQILERIEKAPQDWFSRRDLELLCSSRRCGRPISEAVVPANNGCNGM